MTSTRHKGSQMRSNNIPMTSMNSPNNFQYYNQNGGPGQQQEPPSGPLTWSFGYWILLVLLTVFFFPIAIPIWIAYFIYLILKALVKSGKI